MRYLAWLTVTACLACTRPNPDACCTSEAQCESFGISGGIRNCSGSNVCDTNGACVAPQCTTSADCTDPTAPICQDRFCVASCATNTDCDGVPGAPICEPDGTCGECATSTDCTGSDGTVCDGSSHACRGCIADTECDSGVCIEATGACPGSDAILYVEDHGSDSGTCTEDAPCGTLDFAATLVTAQRDVIKILGAQLQISTTVRLKNISVDIDGSQTTLTSFVGSGTPAFLVQQGATVDLEQVTLSGSASSAAILSVQTSARVELFDASLEGVTISADGGALDLESSSATADAVPNCGSGGTLIINRCQLGDSEVFAATSCTAVTITRSHLSSDGSRLLSLLGGFVVVENDLLTSNSQFTDVGGATDASAGSVVRFNTFFNSSGINEMQNSLLCDDTVEVTSNIIAWNTSNTPSCQTTYSLFDAITTQLGSGNHSADSATFFVSPDTNDFHLTSASPAKSAADPAQTSTTQDFDGNPRPNPAGSTPDIGAFEAP